MGALSKDIKSDAYGGEESPIPVLYQFPVAAATTIYGGAIVGTDASGNAVPATASAVIKLWGRAERQVVNTTAAGFGNAGDLQVLIKPGVFYFDNDTGANAVTNSQRGAYVFALDDHTVSLSDAAGTRPLAGYVIDVPASGQPESGKVAVAVGMARPDALSPELGAASTAYLARAVATSVATYTTTGGVITVTATGQLGSQDGVSMVAGDVLMMIEGMTGSATADAGPYVVTSVGSATTQPVFTRADWWPHGGTITPGAIIKIGGEGTLYKGSDWKAFAAKGGVIGTNAPAFYPDYVCQSVTLASGLITITNVPVLSTTKTYFGINRTTVGGTVTTTVQYNPSAIAAGVLNTGSFQIAAQTSTGATNTADTSTLNIAVENW
jgi:hypothetical protein